MILAAVLRLHVMARLQTLLTDLVLGESPRWHDNRLWFSDWGAHEVVAVDTEGTREVVLEIDAFPFSIDWLLDGRLAVVGNGLVQRREADGSLTTHADLRDVSGYPWNEIIVDARGNIYVNNIGFDMMHGEAPSTGTVALVRTDGTVTRVADDLQFPNGMAVTDDNSTLIVAESYAGRLTAFDITADGTLMNRRVWAAVPGSAPDGICLDATGAVWFADVPNRRCVRVREGGEVLDTVDADRGCFACMLGGVAGTTLFVMAAEWHGPDAVDDARSGQVLTAPAPAPRAGRP
jgi:sugar lactone lactonase YvrE